MSEALLSDDSRPIIPMRRGDPSMKHVLSIDQGTTGTTALMIGADGRVAGRGYQEITQHYPAPGWVEHDADEILERTLTAAREAVAVSGVKPDAIGITNQRETVVVWHRDTGKPLARAIVWQDRRTTDRCAQLKSKSKWIAERTGLRPDPYFSATKIEWLLKRPEIAFVARNGRLLAGTIDTWLIWKLTGGRVHATDPTNASRTLLYDINRLRWSKELCDLFGVPMEVLPEVRASAGDFGRSLTAFFGKAIPITGVAGDQQAALFGQGCFGAGQAKNTYGTGAFLLLNTGKKIPRAGEGLLATVACDETGGVAYAFEAAIFIAGAAIQWLRDGLGILFNAAESERLAMSLESNDGVYFVPALVGLGAPNWEPRARGTIVGLTRGSSRAHLTRAALESMAYGTAEMLQVMAKRARIRFASLRVDGGASANNWLMQFQADVLGIPVERPDMIETTALGAAGLAGIAGGVWRDANEFMGTRSFERFTPAIAPESARELVAGWDRAVRASLGWARDTGDAPPPKRAKKRAAPRATKTREAKLAPARAASRLPRPTSRRPK
ncbi:MAG TPA: glycerol kinase GlpK [Gemmatimonadaceae bacterium]|jgi:glycerol kinase|nr:glycerol kinase GlpK [Gemmatimonadaceae bacterium]